MEAKDYKDIYNFLKSGNFPRKTKSSRSNFRAKAKKFKIHKDGYLTRNGKQVLKKSQLQSVWLEMHMHSGRQKFWERLKARFYFRGGEKWVRQKTRECVACANKNYAVWKADVSPLIPIKCTPKPFWRVHLDLMGAFPKTKNGNKYVGIAVCAFTKYIEGMGNIFFESSRTWIISRFFSSGESLPSGSMSHRPKWQGDCRLAQSGERSNTQLGTVGGVFGS